ncbi:MAG: DUF664 domain-containing protein [Chloroflexi bacterium]|nr:DUF664 domain-containing protein [Chloroflexota bacterium]
MHAADSLSSGSRRFLQSLEGINHADWAEAGVCGWWSVKEIVAHLTSYEALIFDVIGSLLDDTPTPTLDARRSQSHQEFVDQQVAARADHSPQQLLDEYSAHHAKTMERIQRLPLEEQRRTGSLPWYGEEYDLEDYVAYVGLAHKREHGAQINVFKDKLIARAVNPA